MVTLRLTSTRDDVDALAVTVRTPDDAPLLEARLADALDTPLSFRLPPDVDTLEVVVLDGEGAEQVLLTPVIDGAATVEVR